MTKEYEVPEGTNLFINDTPLDTRLVSCSLNRAKSCSPTKFVVFNRQELTQPLSEVVESDISKNDRLGIIFPGQGSQRVKEVISPRLLQDMKNRGVLFNTSTQREYNGSRPQSVRTDIPASLIEKINAREILGVRIIDDVVASGQTIQSMRDDIKMLLAQSQPADKNYSQETRFSFPQITIPKISFVVFTWLLQKSAKTQDINIFASTVYSRRSGKVPLNSLSTLLNDDEKSVAVKKAYALKYFQNATEFFDIIDRLKKYI